MGGAGVQEAAQRCGLAVAENEAEVHGPTVHGVRADAVSVGTSGAYDYWYSTKLLGRSFPTREGGRGEGETIPGLHDY